MKNMMEEAPDDEVEQWLETLGTGPAVRVELTRLQPKEWCGRLLSGALGSYDELIDWETIRSHHGGGKYRLVIKKPDIRGRLVYRACRTLKIAGDPFIQSLMIDV